MHLHVKKKLHKFLTLFCALFKIIYIDGSSIRTVHFIYRISGYFPRWSNFCFFGITFKSQHIQYAEIISSNVWQKKLLNRKKWLTQIKIGTHFLLFCKFCDTRKKDIRYALKLIIVMIDKNTPKLFNINPPPKRTTIVILNQYKPFLHQDLRFTVVKEWMYMYVSQYKSEWTKY